jgi:hypothetical protein
MRAPLLVIAILLSAGSASAETSSTAPPTEIPTPPVDSPLERPMVRNIGIAEQGDAIIVRERKAEPVLAPATKPEQR